MLRLNFDFVKERGSHNQQEPLSFACVGFLSGSHARPACYFDFSAGCATV
jgi:hypothetical protein